MPRYVSVNGQRVTLGGSNMFSSDPYFRIKVDTSRIETGSSDSFSIRIPTTGIDPYDFIIDWGDGNKEKISGIAPTVEHTYLLEGEYNISIIGTFPTIYYNSNTYDRRKIIGIDNLGSDIIWKSVVQAFNGCSSLKYVKGDSNFSNISNLSAMNMFRLTSLDNVYAYDWDMSNFTSLLRMFSASGVNNIFGIEKWDVSNVTDMRAMFEFCSITNLDISKWDVSNVTHMSGMFFATNSWLDSEYDKVLIAWSQLPLQNNVMVDFGDAQYSPGSAADAKQHIIDTYNWTISDGGILV